MKLFFIAAVAGILFFTVSSPSISGTQLSEELIARGSAHLEAGRYEKAAAMFESAKRIDPDNVQARVGLGLSYLKLGDKGIATVNELVKKAISELHVALSLGSSDPEVHLALGSAYLLLNNKEAALREYEILNTIDKEFSKSLDKKIKEHRIPHIPRSEDNTLHDNERSDIVPDRRECAPGETFNIIFRRCYKVEEAVGSDTDDNESPSSDPSNKELESQPADKSDRKGSGIYRNNRNIRRMNQKRTVF